MAKLKSKSATSKSQDKNLVSALKWARSKKLTTAGAGKRISPDAVLKGAQLRAARKWLEAFTYEAKVLKVGRGAKNITDERVAGAARGRIAIIPKAGETVSISKNAKGVKQINVIETYRGKKTRTIIGELHAKSGRYALSLYKGQNAEQRLYFDTYEEARNAKYEYDKRKNYKTQAQLSVITISFVPNNGSAETVEEEEF
jgi:hypothetical protein